ncbi:MAG: helix-turn-helix domain-containing protein [Candidatus Aenigmatarchaeota archaeon]
MAFLIEEGKKQKAYESLLITNPKLFSCLSNELALKIISILSKKPSCAMDIARKLKEHEQKIYYHLRNLEEIGLIKLERTEERVGAIAKIYSISYPVVSFKLFEGKEIINSKIKVREIKFFNSFIRDGKLEAKIIVGSPDPHGKYAAQASDGCCAIDLALFLGSLLKEVSANYKLDTEVKEEELKENLILVGGPKANIIVERINKSLPIYFDFHREWNIVSPFSKQVYVEDEIGVIEKIKNPFNPEKEILVLSGKRFKGTRAAIIGLINYLEEIEKGNKFSPNFIAKVVLGIDRDSDGRIDDVEFLE